MNVSQVKDCIAKTDISSVVVVSRLFYDEIVEFRIKPSELLNKIKYEADEVETTCQVVGDEIWILGTPKGG